MIVYQFCVSRGKYDTYEKERRKEEKNAIFVKKYTINYKVNHFNK